MCIRIHQNFNKLKSEVLFRVILLVGIDHPFSEPFSEGWVMVVITSTDVAIPHGLTMSCIHFEWCTSRWTIIGPLKIMDLKWRNWLGNRATVYHYCEWVWCNVAVHRGKWMQCARRLLFVCARLRIFLIIFSVVRAVPCSSSLTFLRWKLGISKLETVCCQVVLESFQKEWKELLSLLTMSF